jgi:hypothetical protein
MSTIAFVITQLTTWINSNYYSLIREEIMRAFKGEHSHTSITERWQAVDAYLECVTHCNSRDGIYLTTCIAKYLESSDNERS